MSESFFRITKVSKNQQSSCYRIDLIICLFSSVRLVSSRPKLAVFRPLMIAGASSLDLTKGFVLGPYQGALTPHEPLH